MFQAAEQTKVFQDVVEQIQEAIENREGNRARDLAQYHVKRFNQYRKKKEDASGAI